jgi:hypothetical protein
MIRAFTKHILRWLCLTYRRLKPEWQAWHLNGRDDESVPCLNVSGCLATDQLNRDLKNKK